jgi:hypothetical protein
MNQITGKFNHPLIAMGEPFGNTMIVKNGDGF